MANPIVNIVATAIVNWVTANFQATGNYATGTGTADGTNTGDDAVNTTSNAYADSLVIGLLDDRGNWNPATGFYPDSGGSGAAGAVLKGDLWTISGLGLGVSTLMGSVTVTDGDVVRALVNSPAQTDANWVVTENNFGYTAENQTNKTDAVTGNETSSTKYLSVKGVYDWIVGLLGGAAYLDIGTTAGTVAAGDDSRFTQTIQLACSDELSFLTAGTAKISFRMPFAMTLTDVRGSVNEAATGATLLTVDINEGASSILSTKLTFDATELTTTTAATPAVISDSALADDALITVDIDAIGSTLAGKGLKITLIGTR